MPSLLELLPPRARSTLRRWWSNPLLAHARRAQRFDLALAARLLLGGSALALLLTLLGWLLTLRPLGALMTFLSLGASLLLLSLAALGACFHVLTLMRDPATDPRGLRDIRPPALRWGLALAWLWRLRWLVLAALLLVPALTLSLLRLDLLDFAIWRESALTLGSATAAGRARFLLPGGGIPYLRLALRALSGALLAWSLLPLFTLLGVSAALVFSDSAISPLSSLLAASAAAMAALLAWNSLSLTPALQQGLEALRALLLIALLAIPPGLAALTNHWLPGPAISPPPPTQSPAAPAASVPEDAKLPEAE